MVNTLNCMSRFLCYVPSPFLLLLSLPLYPYPHYPCTLQSHHTPCTLDATVTLATFGYCPWDM